MAVTWNPADKYSTIVLSGDNLTATASSTLWKSVRATESKSSGKWYFECLVNTASGTAYGIMGSTHNTNRMVGQSVYTSGTGQGWGLHGTSGTIYYANSGTSSYGTALGDGDIFMCAVDLDAGNVWFGGNGTWFGSGNPATGANPTYTGVDTPIYPACSPYYTTTSSITGRFTAASQTYSPPSGFEAFEYVDPSIPAESLTWTPQPLDQTGHVRQNFLPAATLTWAAQAPVNALSHLLAAGTLGWTGQAPGNLLSHNLPSGALTWSAKTLQQTYGAPSYAIAVAIYRCYLTGDAETPPVADLELPLASFQSRRRNGTQTYLAITVPDPVSYIDAINARTNGDIVIYSGYAVGDTETTAELIRVNFGSFRYDLGPRSGTAQLTGHKQVTYSNPKTRALSGISYQSVIDGVNLVRCEPDMWLNPGDTADIGDSTFVVDTITYIIKPTRAYMEVQEVAA